jgi:predicted nucleic acid-binding Zn ribbon protein
MQCFLDNWCNFIVKSVQNSFNTAEKCREIYKIFSSEMARVKMMMTMMMMTMMVVMGTVVISQVWRTVGKLHLHLVSTV